MLPTRFLPGLLAGLLVGVPLGALVALQLAPAVSSSEVPDLKARLERTERGKESLSRQLREFQSAAERMTASFAALERRFNALEEQLHAREASPSPAAPQL